MKKESELAHISHIQELIDNAIHIGWKIKVCNEINNKPKNIKFLGRNSKKNNKIKIFCKYSHQRQLRFHEFFFSRNVEGFVMTYWSRVIFDDTCRTLKFIGVKCPEKRSVSAVTEELCWQTISVEHLKTIKLLSLKGVNFP